LENLETLAVLYAGHRTFQTIALSRFRSRCIRFASGISVDEHVLAQIENKIGIQHHHAHIASCIADNKIDGEIIGATIDGRGGPSRDCHGATHVGRRILRGEFATADRVAHPGHVPLPGGAKAVREP